MATFNLNALVNSNPQGLRLNNQTLPGFIRLMTSLGWKSLVRSDDLICLDYPTIDQYDIEIIKLGPDLYEVVGTDAN